MKTVSNVPQGYDYQTLEDMRRVFQGIGFKAPYSPDTMHDFANVAASRAVGEEPTFKETEDEYFQKLSKFLMAVDFSKYSGNSPLGRAASLYVAMHNAGMLAKGTSKKHKPKEEKKEGEDEDKDNQNDSKPCDEKGEKQEGEDKEPGDGEGEGESEDPEFDFNQDPNAVDSEQSMDGMVSDFLPESDGDDESDDDPDGEEKPSKKEGKKPPKDKRSNQRADPEALAQSVHDVVIKQREFAGSAAALYTRTDGIIPEMDVNKLDSKQKDLIAKLTIVKDRRQIQNHRHFTALKMQKMTKHDQVANQADMSRMALPDYDLQFILKNLRVGVKEPHGKQCAVYLVDSSGSMRSGEKIEWVRSILLDRYDQVLTGQAELYVVPYEGEPFWDQAIHIANKADVRKHINWMPAFNLGWTQIQNVVEKTCQSIQKGMVGKFKIKGERPEIVVVCDGDDHCDKSFKPAIRTHAFILGQKNAGLKSMCDNSGGSYEEFYVRDR